MDHDRLKYKSKIRVASKFKLSYSRDAPFNCCRASLLYADSHTFYTNVNSI